MTVFGQMYFGVGSAYAFLMFLLLEKEKKFHYASSHLFVGIHVRP